MIDGLPPLYVQLIHFCTEQLRDRSILYKIEQYEQLRADTTASF